MSRTAHVLMIGLGVAACESGTPLVGLPKPDFDRAFTAGLDVAAAEQCGVAVDAGLVRHKLVEQGLARGWDDARAEKYGLAFDKTRSEYARRLAAKPDYCATQYTTPADRLAGYAIGDFPDPP